MDTKVNYVVNLLNARMVSVEDLKSGKFKIDVPINRCPFLDEIEAVNNGYTKKDAEELQVRATTYLGSFLTTGYCKGKPIKVAHCEEDDTWYLIDGIGRISAMHLAEKKHKELPFDEVTVLFYSCPTLSDVRAFTEHNNTLKQKDWSSKQKAGSHAKAVGGEAEDIFNDLVYYQEEVIKTESSHIVGAIYYGDKWSHMNGADYTRKQLRPYHEAYKEAYAIFVNEVGKQFDESKDEKKKKRDKVVRGQNPGIVLMSYLAHVENQSIRYGLNPHDKIIDAAKRIVDRWSGKNATNKEFFYSMTLNKSHKPDIASSWDLCMIDHMLFENCPEVEKSYNKWVMGKTERKKKNAA